MRRHVFVISLIVALPVLFFGAVSSAVADEPPAPVAGLVEVGRGELNWFGLGVYDAHLYTTSGRFEGLQSGRIALEIRYERDISSEQLVETTRKEWRRLAGSLQLNDPARKETWLEAVGAIWPDVSDGDRIITVVEPDGPTRFFGNAGALGVIDDPEFGPALLGIWLHPETRVADLRAELIGSE
ncbi:MAG: chalcone isomerase family protein [Gammaproteobacteria bacterium]